MTVPDFLCTMNKFISYATNRFVERSRVVGFSAYTKDGKFRIAIEVAIGEGKLTTMYSDAYSSEGELNAFISSFNNELNA